MPLTEAQRAAIRAEAIASGEVPEHLRAEAIRLLSAPATAKNDPATGVTTSERRAAPTTAAS